MAADSFAPDAAARWDGLPAVTPTRAELLRDQNVDGEARKVLWSVTSENSFCFVQTLRSCLMGKVKYGVVCYPLADGTFHIEATAIRVAIKILSKACVARGVTLAGHRVLENPLREVAVMFQLRELEDPSFVKLYEYLEDDDNYYIVMEYVDGKELFDFWAEYAEKKLSVPEDVARRLMYHAVRGTARLHSLRIAHLDMSLENCLVGNITTPPPFLKLIDFGVAAIVSPGQLLVRWNGKVGKDRYRPYEVANGMDYDPFAVDVWCLGVMLYMMLSGAALYNHAVDTDAVFNWIKRGRFEELAAAWSHWEKFSPAAWDLVARMLCVRPEERITIAEAEAHAWFDPERAEVG